VWLKIGTPLDSENKQTPYYCTVKIRILDGILSCHTGHTLKIMGTQHSKGQHTFSLTCRRLQTISGTCLTCLPIIETNFRMVSQICHMSHLLLSVSSSLIPTFFLRQHGRSRTKADLFQHFHRDNCHSKKSRSRKEDSDLLYKNWLLLKNVS
jgi:hypothetical protein